MNLFIEWEVSCMVDKIRRKKKKGEKKKKRREGLS